MEDVLTIGLTGQEFNVLVMILARVDPMDLTDEVRGIKAKLQAAAVEKQREQIDAAAADPADG